MHSGISAAAPGRGRAQSAPCSARSSGSWRWTTSGTARAGSASRTCYLPTPESEYYYKNGVNTQALKAFIPSSAIALVLALVSTFDKVAPFSWFIGAGLGALCYYAITRGRPLVESGSVVEPVVEQVSTEPTSVKESGRPDPPSIHPHRSSPWRLVPRRHGLGCVSAAFRGVPGLT